MANNELIGTLKYLLAVLLVASGVLAIVVVVCGSSGDRINDAGGAMIPPDDTTGSVPLCPSGEKESRPRKAAGGSFSAFATPSELMGYRKSA